LQAAAALANDDRRGTNLHFLALAICIAPALSSTLQASGRTMLSNNNSSSSSSSRGSRERGVHVLTPKLLLPTMATLLELLLLLLPAAASAAKTGPGATYQRIGEDVKEVLWMLRRLDATTTQQAAVAADQPQITSADVIGAVLSALLQIGPALLDLSQQLTGNRDAAAMGSIAGNFAGLTVKLVIASSFDQGDNCLSFDIMYICDVWLPVTGLKVSSFHA
jgi:hypothetical protein